MIKKTKRQSKYFAPQNPDGDYHVCDHPGCNKAGEYRAPKNSRLKEYYWFCLDHVKEYNAKWNYYDNENTFDEEYSKQRHFNFSSHLKYDFDFSFNDGYGFFKYTETFIDSPGIKLTADERQALKIMNIEYEEINVDSLKKAYKKAVKKYHPDLNSSAKESEEIFKILSTSYKSILAKLTGKN